jgi:hypothetical protein
VLEGNNVTLSNLSGDGIANSSDNGGLICIDLVNGA